MAPTCGPAIPEESFHATAEAFFVLTGRFIGDSVFTELQFHRWKHMDNMSPLFVGAINRVYAIDRVSGQVVWQRTLNDKFFKMGSNFVNLDFDGEALFAAVFGELYCLDPQNGKIRWCIPLQGTRANPITFASSPTCNREAAVASLLSDKS